MPSEGLIGRDYGSSTSIETFSGKLFCLADPRPEDVDPTDVAHHLSMLCRFCGAVRSFYSVAEHCCHVHDYLVEQGRGPVVAFAGLVHDALEAYVGDATLPLKRLRPEIRSDENRVDAVICQAWRVDTTDHTRHLVKDADIVLCRAEAHRLCHSEGDKWEWPTALPLYMPLIQCWQPNEARGEWLRRFFQYRTKEK